MKCNYCGFENKEGAKFCQECGAKLEGERVNTSKRCKICGTENTADASFCSICGSQLKSEQQNYYRVEQNVYSQNIYSNEDPNAKLAQSAMVTGIVAIVCTITCCLFVIGFICGIISTILGSMYLVKSKNANFPKGKAIAGLVCGIIAVLIGVYLIFDFIVVLSSEEYRELIQKILDEMYSEGPTETGLKMFMNILK